MVAGEESLHSVMAEDPIPTRDDADSVETRRTPRATEKLPTPAPSVHVPLLMSSPETLFYVVTTPCVHASHLDRKEADIPRARQRSASLSLSRLGRRLRRYEDNPYSDSVAYVRSLRRSRRKSSRFGRRRRRRAPSDSDFTDSDCSDDDARRGRRDRRDWRLRGELQSPTVPEVSPAVPDVHRLYLFLPKLLPLVPEM